MIKQVVAKNLFRLRKIAGLNQQEIAEKAGLSRPAYAAIEKGKSDPRSDTLNKIADALNVSIKELFTDMPELKSIRFRMSKVTVQKRKLREQEIIKIARWLENYNYLENELNKKSEYKLKNIRVKDPKKLAHIVREKLGIDHNDPIADITEIINEAGIKLHLNVLNIDDFFGLSIGKDDGGPAISINLSQNISIERQIFTAAHEMAHLILHGNSFEGDLLEDDKEEETEANIFASYFLMPEKSFEEEVERNRGLHWVDMVLNIKRYFKVSYRTVLMRLIDTGMVDNSIHKNFSIEYKRIYGGSLRGHFEPAALTDYGSAVASREPDGSAKTDVIENRLYNLVREGIEKSVITLSKAAEILNKTDLEMRELVNSWGEINWEKKRK